MTMTVTQLCDIRDWLAEHALKGLQYQRPADESIAQYELVTPVAHLGYLPPGGTLPEDGVSIPGIVVGLDKKTSDADGVRLELRVTVAVYDPGYQPPAEGGGVELQPNLEGYVTLLNLMDTLEQCILGAVVLAERYVLASPVEAKPYDEQAYPYWYGYLKFAVELDEYPRVRYADALR